MLPWCGPHFLWGACGSQLTALRMDGGIEARLLYGESCGGLDAVCFVLTVCVAGGGRDLVVGFFKSINCLF